MSGVPIDNGPRTTDAPPLAARETALAGEQIDAQTRLHSRWLLPARVAWFVIVGAMVALLLLSYPLQAQILRTPCTSDCQPGIGQLTAGQMQELSSIGLSLDAYVVYFVALGATSDLVFLTVGALIFWRKSDDWMALLVSLMLVLNGLGNEHSSVQLLASIHPTLGLLVATLQFLGVALLVLFVMLFPNGRIVPTWSRWILPFILAREAINTFATKSELGGGTTGSIVLVVELAIGIGIVTYRYLRVSGPIERQQTKWVVYGVAISFIGFAIFSLIIPTPASMGRLTVLSFMIANLLLYVFMLIPISILIAVLRYRLYDIDVLINRTLVYIPLTAILAGLFAATTKFSQDFFVALTGESSNVTAVFTTLIVVAAFTPIKNGLQTVVDKRFKEGADPAKRLAAFRELVGARVFMIDPPQVMGRFLQEAAGAFGAVGGEVSLEREGVEDRVSAIDPLTADMPVNLAIESDGRRLGTLRLGARHNGAPFSKKDFAALEQTASTVAQAIADAANNRY
jgi:hypothetical protein